MSLLPKGQTFRAIDATEPGPETDEARGLRIKGERDRLAVQIAACQLASSGHPEARGIVPGDYAYTMAFGSIRALREERDRLRADLEKAIDAGASFLADRGEARKGRRLRTPEARADFLRAAGIDPPGD